jgi:membrane protease YdiL (CAAX protease family)
MSGLSERKVGESWEGWRKTMSGSAELRTAGSFFAVVFALSAPFWIVGAFVRDTPSWVPMHLPFAALTFPMPLVAGVLLERRAGRMNHHVHDIARALDPRAPGLTPWLLVSALLMPVVFVAAYFAQRALHMPLPAEPRVPWGTAFLLFPIFFVGAVGEEAGWMLSAARPMQRRLGAPVASVALGCVWAAWHIIPWLQMGRSPSWIAWWSLAGVASRVLIVWASNRARGSLLPAVTYHTMINVCGSLFPNAGSHMSPAVIAILTAPIAVAVMLTSGSRACDA